MTENKAIVCKGYRSGIMFPLSPFSLTSPSEPFIPIQRVWFRISEMYRSITMRIEPDSEQRMFIDESIRVHHYVYNALITAVKLYFSNNGRMPSQNELNSLCTEMWRKNEWMHGMYQNTMNQASKRVLDAFRSCNPKMKQRSKKKKDGNTEGAFVLRSPRYKKLSRSNTFGYISSKTFKIITEKDDDGKERRSLSLGKMKGTLRCYNQSTPIRGEPKTVVITRRDIGTHFEYFATIQYE